MTLTTHSIIAAAVTKPLARMNPLIALVVAIATHYLSDAIPHWDYKIVSIENAEDKENRHFGSSKSAIIKDIFHFALDGFLGAIIIILITRPATLQQWLWIAAAVIGGCLPDFLQGLYVLKLKFLRLPQRFHDMFHTHIRLGAYPLLGIPFQIVITAISAYALM